MKSLKKGRSAIARSVSGAVAVPKGANLYYKLHTLVILPAQRERKRGKWESKSYFFQQLREKAPEKS